MIKRRILFGLLLASLGALVVISDVPQSKASHAGSRVSVHATNKPSVSPSPTPVATEAPSAAPTNRLQIPTIGVNAPIINIGVTKDGSLDAPKTLYQVGVYTGGPWPGMAGTSILDGHSGSPTQHGVLEHISRLKVGDQVSVVAISGKQTHFTVTSSQAYPAIASTANVLFAKTVSPTLNMISCYGNWNDKTQEFDQRWIVKANLVD